MPGRVHGPAVDEGQRRLHGSFMTGETDIVVAGGGPAGATIAARLAAFGYRVVLLEKRRFPRHQVGESLTPAILPLLDFLDVRAEVEAAGFLRMAGHSVCWGSAAPRTAYYSPDRRRRGFQCVRAAFDRILLDRARQAGVRVLEGQPVQDVAEGPQGIRIRYRQGERIHAAFCVDATGRAGVCARRGRRQRDIAFQTLALTGYWRHAAGPPGTDFANTLLEAYSHGMVWSVPLHTGLRNVTLLIDWRRGAALMRGRLRDFYVGELRHAGYVSGLLSAARLVAGPHVFDASLYTARGFTTRRSLLAGDAGLTIDPLSSEGVRKALASAVSGAAVVNTILRRPAMRNHAAALYDAAQRDTYDDHYRQSVRYHAEEGRWPESPFWQRRRGAPLPEPAAPPASPSGASVEFSPFEARPVSHLSVAPEAVVREQPVIEGAYVELRPVVVTPRYPRGLRFLSGVDVPRLLECVRMQGAIPDVLAAYRHTPGGRPTHHAAEVRQVLARLCQDGVLRPTGPAESRSG